MTMVDDELSRLPLWSLLGIVGCSKESVTRTLHMGYGGQVLLLSSPKREIQYGLETSHSVSSLGLASWLSGSESIILSITLIHSRTGCSAIPTTPRAKNRERHSRSCRSEVGPGEALGPDRRLSRAEYRENSCQVHVSRSDDCKTCAGVGRSSRAKHSGPDRQRSLFGPLP
jgi:hypothetical protein